MDCISILAQASQTAAETQAKPQIVPIDLIYNQITSLSWHQAVIAISFGVVYLLYGWRIFRVLAVISFALLGLCGGMWAGRQFNNEFLGGGIGLVVLAILSVPLIRWAISILGAAAGGIITAGVWYAFKLPEEYIWAGGLVGVVAGGMISFIIFKIAVMLFSSLGGAAIMVTGVLALLHHYPPTTEQIHELIYTENWFLPLVLIVPTLVGVFLQNKFVKNSAEWSV